MAKKGTLGKSQVGDYRHKGAKRKNNPPAGIAPTYEAHERQTQKYSFDPHLDPQLVWAGKAEHTAFDVDVVSLHIHERVSTRAILEAVKKPEPQMALFGNNELPADKQIEFYRHDVGWANRLILGDSLLVMNSLLVKEGMAGKVQCIYIDPPYGIKYASNMQARTDRRDVKDKDEDLTREPEQIKAYRDTWKLGIHSYLTYLRDRLLLAKDLLADSGSVFVQIGDENVHVVRSVMDEIFGGEGFVALVAFATSTGSSTVALPRVTDYLLWYARETRGLKFHKLYGDQDEEFSSVGEDERGEYELADMTSQHPSETRGGPLHFQGGVFLPSERRQWSFDPANFPRVVAADRVLRFSDKQVRWKKYRDERARGRLSNRWDDTQFGAFSSDKQYVVQTHRKVIERCILMTTDPGDLVFDPTCGSETTAFCAEKWGRRWVTCDTSRVALQIARQRLLTAKYDYFELQDTERGPSAGFKYETVPHITLESIAKNSEIDAIGAKYQPEIDEALKVLNKALKGVTVSPKSVTLSGAKSLRRGKAGDSSALPQNDKRGEGWQEWEVPREAEKDWPKDAREAHRRFWTAKQAKRKGIDATIQRNAPQETLYDRPFKKSGVVRVSGPFTVEAIPAPAMEAPDAATPVPQFETSEAEGRISDKAGDYLSDMIGLLKLQGSVIFPKGRKMELTNIRPVSLGFLHAEAEAPSPQPSPNGRGGGNGDGKTLKVAISFGPQHGPVTAYQVQESTPAAKMNGYDVLLFCGFSFDPEARALIQKAPVKGLTVDFVNVAPDVLIGDLLKTSRASQIFTAYGEPDVRVTKGKDDTLVVELAGVDIYDPLTGKAESTGGEDVAAWFLDTDYDGMTFHICQAFFPGDKDAWDKLQRALKAQIEPEAFALMRGTKSFPFQPGKHKRIAVKVIDFRGNEVMRVMGVGTDATAQKAR
ncbi:MAG: site-specific DNA-methyltransferase [candidate division WOR-3 bacterium]|nr:site-specific DNA-methyltransferase [candidate division WOR-3 bacterium]